MLNERLDNMCFQVTSLQAENHAGHQNTDVFESSALLLAYSFEHRKFGVHLH